MNQPLARFDQFRAWLRSTDHHFNGELTPLCGDASFRRYYRYTHQEQSYIAVDAPPDTENTAGFVAVAKTWKKQGLWVPTVYHYELEQGFMVLSDLGDQQYLPHLTPKSADLLYHHAFTALVKIQHCKTIEHYELPLFDAPRIQQECALFKVWFLEKHLGLRLNRQQEKAFASLVDYFITLFTAQPQVCVHRDYHSRNLMIRHNTNNHTNNHESNIGILDFQDAVLGPISYDLVSLLRDCYIAWPAQQVSAWVATYHDLLSQEKALPLISLDEFRLWFDHIGVQRHLKAIGIFARKFQRDGVKNYLNDIPRTLRYVLTISTQYPVLNPLTELLEQVLETT